MSVHGLGAPNDASASEAAPTKKQSDRSQAAAPVAAGSATGPDVVRADPVLVTPESSELKHYYGLLTKFLASNDEPKGISTVFYWTVVNVLLVKSGHRVSVDSVSLVRTRRLTDIDIQRATDGLVEDWRKTNAARVKIGVMTNFDLASDAATLRQTSDCYRQELAIKALKGSFEEKQQPARDALNTYALDWIIPRGREADPRHYSLNQIGQLLFNRLCAATKELTGSQAAHVMAQVYDASLKLGIGDVPISIGEEPATSVRELRNHLEGAASGEDLVKARKLIAAYSDRDYLFRLTQ